MQRHAVIVSIKAKHRNLEIEIEKFQRVAISFVCKVRKELLNEKNGDELALMRKRKQEHCQRPALSLSLTHSLRTPEFDLRVNEDADADVDADAYVETLQTIVVKPPWTDSVASGGRPPCLPTILGSIP
ncbi:hypothetical protein ACTXT7_007104 [Hymenolepis weldensis]